jgi:hypothetical protein
MNWLKNKSFNLKKNTNIIKKNKSKEETINKISYGFS